MIEPHKTPDLSDSQPTTGAQFADVPNLILTPHIAGVTGESKVRVSAVTAEAVARHLDA
jgi:(S)-sulfolactate dehydrogenase